MKNYLETIGIDVSKKTIDVHIHHANCHKVFDNNLDGFIAMFVWIGEHTTVGKNSRLFCLEHTGIYCELLIQWLSDTNECFTVVSGLDIKKSLGIVRGKNDKVDAKRIANYAWEKRDKITLSEKTPDDLVKIKRLNVLRNRVVKIKSGFKASYNEIKSLLSVKENKKLFKVHQYMIKVLEVQEKEIDSEIEKLINKNTTYKTQYENICSIKGVGSQTAIKMIILTGGFTKFKTWRQFASYSGIAPFSNSSGTSYKGKTKISHIANKEMKSLFDLCARSAIVHNPEMKLFYNNRIELGKNKKSTRNIVRNKICARIFAVVKRDSPYINITRYAA